MTRPVYQTKHAWGGDYVSNSNAEGEFIGHAETFAFPNVASVTAGVALTAIQARLFVPFRHRPIDFSVMASAVTAVAAGTDPAAAIYRSLPQPTAPTVALASPAVAGNVDDGTHGYAIAHKTSAGTSIVSETAYVTVADKSTNGKVNVTWTPGPTGTVSTDVYRTEAGGSILILLANVADNTTCAYLDNTADSGLSGAVPVLDASGVTILSSTVKLSATDRPRTNQILSGTFAAGIRALEWDACIYTLRALTGAATGAITNLNAILRVERVPE